jgi:hypothetical protein
METWLTAGGVQPLLDNPNLWGENEIAILLATSGATAQVMRVAAERVHEV